MPLTGFPKRRAVGDAQSSASQPYRIPAHFPKQHGSTSMTTPDRTTAERALALVCSKWVRVVGDSMAPTLKHGQWLRVDRRAYRRAEPRRGDVVLFEHPRRAGFLEVKRIAGIPGDVMTVAGDRADDGAADALAESGDGGVTIGADRYFVVGDNRPHSTDSRAFGPISRRQIVGKVVAPKVEPPPG